MKLMEVAKKSITKNNTQLKPYMFQTKPEIEEWMKLNNIEGFVNRELEIEPSNSNTHLGQFGNSPELYINVKGEQRLPVQFKLAINFDSGYEEVNSLIGFPYVVLGNCYIYNAKLKNLEGCPNLVDGSFQIKLANSHLYNLEGFSEHCKRLRILSVSKNNSVIDSVDGISKEMVDLEIGCGFTDIANIYKNCKALQELWIITSPEQGKKYNFLSVFKFRNLKGFMVGTVHDETSNDHKATEIFNKHLHNDKDVLECQEELITNGLRIYARM
jgi:hypothetical protein